MAGHPRRLRSRPDLANRGFPAGVVKVQLLVCEGIERGLGERRATPVRCLDGRRLTRSDALRQPPLALNCPELPHTGAPPNAICQTLEGAPPAA